MRVLFFIFFLFFCQITFSQNDFKVVSFKHMPDDYSAIKAYNRVFDVTNGDQTAIIKINTNAPFNGFTFELGNNFNIVKSVEKPNEIWLYVPNGTKRISIDHSGFTGKIDTTFTVLEGGNTYQLILHTPKISNSNLLKGKVKLKINPKDSKFFLIFKLPIL